MAPTILPSRKRKVLAEPAPVYDELAGVELDGILSQSEDDSDFEESDIEGELHDNSSENDLDEHDQDAEGDDDDDDAYSEDASSDAGDSFGAPPTLDADNSEPNYRVVKDANGGERYEYAEVDPVYDSDDSDAQGPVNTIGDIPLSFYDSYPHIGYDINGKKIMRPATGEALDALLDSIEIPKGWTGLTDPETGKPLDLTQDQLELLKRLQMNEVPNEGYDPYPVWLSFYSNLTVFVTNMLRTWSHISQVLRRRCPSALRQSRNDDLFPPSMRQSEWLSWFELSRRGAFCHTNPRRSAKERTKRRRSRTMMCGQTKSLRIPMS